jgi:dihydrofolate synthase / folylpolyglutamate synthase
VDLALSAPYQEALDFLFARTTGKWRLGLERVAAFLRLLGDPHRRIPCFHVGGTNGKGSVCATLEALLRERGLRVGKYTSPHLVDFRERFLIDGEPVASEHIVEFVERWTPEVEHMAVTFFEATTAMAFDFFAKAEVDVAVIEVGLGGRLDATNVVDPLAAGVVSIGIDHVEFLGHTRQEIAREKAGIFKPGRPAAIGETDLEIRTLLAGLAADAGAAPVRVVADETEIEWARVDADGTMFSVRPRNGHGGAIPLRTPLAGEYQAANTVLALAMLDAAGEPYAPDSDDELRRGLSRIRLPGRFHRAGPFVFDVAHNPDGATVLARTLAGVRAGRPLVCVLSVLADKDWRGVMAALSTVVDLFVITTAPTSPASRAWREEDALAHAAANGWRAVGEHDFDAALGRAEREGATVLVTGSFHTVGDAMARLQINPLGG